MKNLKGILEAARLAPTSSGLQPFEILVVSNQEVKKTSWKKQQVINRKLQMLLMFWFSQRDTLHCRKNQLYVWFNERRKEGGLMMVGKTNRNFLWTLTFLNLQKKTSYTHCKTSIHCIWCCDYCSSFLKV